MSKRKPPRPPRNMNLIGKGKVTKILKDSNGNPQYAKSFEGARKSIKPENFKKTSTISKIPKTQPLPTPTKLVHLKSTTAKTPVSKDMGRGSAIEAFKKHLKKSPPAASKNIRNVLRKPPSKGR